MTKNVLIIDDDGDDRELFCEALENVGQDLTCHTAINGRRAIEILDNNEIEIPDLVFLDVNMPQMNGWQCISVLKQRDVYKDIPVIMYSTSSHAEEIERAHRAGAVCYFTKPANFNDLKQCLELVVSHLDSGSLQALIPLWNVPFFH